MRRQLCIPFFLYRMQQNAWEAKADISLVLQNVSNNLCQPCSISQSTELEVKNKSVSRGLMALSIMNLVKKDHMLHTNTCNTVWFRSQ